MRTENKSLADIMNNTIVLFCSMLTPSELPFRLHPIINKVGERSWEMVSGRRYLILRDSANCMWLSGLLKSYHIPLDFILGFCDWDPRWTFRIISFCPYSYSCLHWYKVGQYKVESISLQPWLWSLTSYSHLQYAFSLDSVEFIIVHFGIVMWYFLSTVTVFSMR